MDEKIVIILTLIFAAFGIFGKRKKKAPAQPAPGSVNPQQSFWDLMQGTPNLQNSMEPEEFEEPEFTAETEYVTQTQNGTGTNDSYQFMAKSEGLSDIPDILKTKSKTKKRRIKSKLMHNFSLRKAVVYSEILNRKYT
jgi:hypothetical protein